MNVLHPIACPGSANLTAMIGAQAGTGPLAPMLVARGHPDLTYGQLEAFLRETAAAFRSTGVRRSDRIAVVLPDGPFPRN